MQSYSRILYYTGVNLSCLKKPTKHPFSCFFTKSYNSWALSIKNASSANTALELYAQMHTNSIPFDSFSILFTLKACTNLHNLTIIHHLHAHITKLGFNGHVYVATSLLHAYAITSFDHARKLFDEMPVRNTVTWNTMITGYSRARDIEKARSVFEGMPFRDIASWSAMITAYIYHGFYQHGLALIHDMMTTGLKPDKVTTGSILSGCAHIGSLGLLLGKSVHGLITKNAWESDLELGTILVDMYSKCGFLKNAFKVFDRMPKRNVLTWTALICGSAQHGHSREALSLFDIMQTEGIKPNELTFTGVLSACVHTGLVEEGKRYFEMIEEYELETRIQHYGCMVVLFGKSGMLEEAYGVIKKMKIESNVIIWSAFLSACKEHRQLGMGERVIEEVMRMVKPENDSGVYSLICDLYVLGEKWDDAERVRKLMLNQNVRKLRGSSSITSVPIERRTYN